ncbi:MAG: hypothetical protein QXS66_09025 [Thermoproteota archaeon]
MVELHIDTLRIEERNGFKILRLSVGNGEHARFVMLIYTHALKEISCAMVSNSRLVVDRGALYLLTVRKDVEVSERRNKLVVDINEDNVACLLIDYDGSRAVLFTINYSISRLRENYRRIRRSIQKEVENIYERNRLPEKYGARERSRIEDRVKKVTTALAEIARACGADLVREKLKNMKLNSRIR